MFEQPPIEQPKKESPKPQRHAIGSRLMREVSIGPVDSSLKKRAEWMVDSLNVKKYLNSKIERDAEGEPKKGVSVLSIGSGKGHELEELDKQLPKSRIIGLDPHDYMTRPVEKRLGKAHDVCYLKETYSAEDMSCVADHSIDAATFCFVLHHIHTDQHAAVMRELSRVLKEDGYVFVAEDLVENEAEHKKTERADRIINLQVRESDPHNYSNIAQWEEFFAQYGFAMREVNEQVAKNGVRHGFFVFQKTSDSAKTSEI